MRLGAVPQKAELVVLDAYHGHGTIWKNVQKRYAGRIRTLKIDKLQKDPTFVCIGENQKFIESLDLKKFDVIDLDAYGVPYEQLDLLFRKKYCGVVFVTFIQSMLGGMPTGILECAGYTKAMIEKCPTLFAKNGIEVMRRFLYKNGVRKIRIRSNGKKHYMCFAIG